MNEGNTAEAHETYHHCFKACRTFNQNSKLDCEKRLVREAKTKHKQFFKYLTTKKQNKKLNNNIVFLTDETVGVLTQDSGQ